MTPGASVALSLQCFPTRDPDLVLLARRLTARRYLRRGFVSAGDIDHTGVVGNDPYVERSQYFVVTDEIGAVVGTSRLIGHVAACLPVAAHRSDFSADGKRIMDEIGEANSYEVSSLVCDGPAALYGPSPVLHLYRSMAQHVWREAGHGPSQPFLMACRPGLFRSLHRLLGDELVPLGPSLPYPGQPAVPAYIDPTGATLRIADRIGNGDDQSGELTRLLQFMAEGVAPWEVCPELADSLRPFS